jgi:pyridoxal phosphate enzyme (YggS family)
MAVALGLTHFGENRVQEAESKAPALADARWEMVGRLQSNKAARAVELFDAVHSVDSLDLAERLDRLAGETQESPYPVFLQVNVDADDAKTGFSSHDLLTAVSRLAMLEHLEIRGLMTVGRLVATPEQARPTFRALRALSVELRSSDERIGAGLSMGMSDDFEVAVEEGATVVRLGRVLFGERPAI